MIILAYYETPSQKYAKEMVEYLAEINRGRMIARESSEVVRRMERKLRREYVEHEERVAVELVRYFITQASEIRKVGLKEGEGIEKLKKLRKNGEGVIRLFNAEYKELPCGNENCKIDYMDGDTYIIAGYPKTNEVLGERLSELALLRNDGIRVIGEHPSMHVGEDSLKITVFPEIRAEWGKVLMKREETENFLADVLLEFEDYFWERYNI